MASRDTPEISSVPSLDHKLRLIARIALVLTIPVVLYFTTRGTWSLTSQNNDGGWSGGFYWAQAESMLVRGRLDVKPTDLLGECFERRGRCYGYFGVTPSLVRLPVLGFLRMFHSALTPLFVAVAVLLAYWAALRILRRALVSAAGPADHGSALAYFSVAAPTLGVGSNLLFAARPAVYEEAMAWAMAFILLTLNHVWAWCTRNARSLTPAVVFGVLAANARPTAAATCGVLGLFAVWWCWRGGLDRRALKRAVALCLLPGLTAAGVFWLKLRTPIPSVGMSKQVQEAPHWRDILARNGGHTSGLRFLPTALTMYFRPDSVMRRSEWPWFDFKFTTESITWVPPMPAGGAYVERPISVTTTMPLPWALTLVAGLSLVIDGWRRFRQLTGGHRSSPLPTGGESSSSAHGLTPDSWTLSAGLLVSAAAMFVLTVTTVGITNRYVSDFFATSIVGLSLAASTVVPWSRRHPSFAAGLLVLGLLFVAWSVLVNLSLTTRLVFNWT